MTLQRITEDELDEVVWYNGITAAHEAAIWVRILSAMGYS